MRRATGRFEPSRRALLKGLLGVGVGAIAGGATHGYLYERHDFEVTRLPFPVGGLPDALRGLRIGFLTDVHRSQTVSHEMVTAAVRLLMAERPDLIVLGGDYVTWGDRRYVHPSADALAPLAAPHGVLAVLGNHDDDRDMPAALAAKGFTVLKDARTRLTIRGEPMDFIGVRYWTHRLADIARIARGTLPYALLLAHTPKRLTEATQLSIPAVLSGHTHGGQIVLPIIGPIAAREFPVIAGLARRQGTTIFVSRGVGTVYVPVRINCPPEVAVLTLESTMPIAS
ncbi:MAG TPA: metallophosphoesterase [Vicinamibacterales bacterium]|nr:metallophosphoesterase [Vicinamibacterales bacterium]